jgi:hypothetical protein
LKGAKELSCVVGLVILLCAAYLSHTTEGTPIYSVPKANHIGGVASVEGVACGVYRVATTSLTAITDHHNDVFAVAIIELVIIARRLLHSAREGCVAVRSTTLKALAHGGAAVLHHAAPHSTLINTTVAVGRKVHDPKAQAVIKGDRHLGERLHRDVPFVISVHAPGVVDHKQHVRLLAVDALS